MSSSIVNGDGIDDLLIGADQNGSASGKTYLVFGSPKGFGSSFNVANLK